MSATKEQYLKVRPYTLGEGRGLSKVRIRCAKCNSIIDKLKEPCPKCKCCVFK